mgnify:CR=1 FL=1
MSRIVLIILCVIAAVAVYLIYAFGEPNSEEWDRFEYENKLKEWRTHFWGGVIAVVIVLVLLFN